MAIHNRSAHGFALVMGVLTGLSAIPHGLSEIAQGSALATDILVRVGAFTLFSDYLVAGIATLTVSLLIIFWSVWGLGRKSGPAGYLVLAVCLFLSGGGVAFTVFALLAWSVATRIHQPLKLWRKILPPRARPVLSKLWLPFFAASLVFLCGGVLIWLFLLPPGEIHTIGFLHYVCWFSLLAGIILLLCTVAAGFARDIERQQPAGQP